MVGDNDNSVVGKGLPTVLFTEGRVKTAYPPLKALFTTTNGANIINFTVDSLSNTLR